MTFHLKLALTLPLAVALATPIFAREEPPAAKAPATTHLKEETRAVWSRSNERYIRKWLMLSDIPLATGFDKDYLTEHGGEVAIHPVEKMSHKLPDGKEIQWRDVKAWGDSADLSDGTGLKRDFVGYAFTTVTRKEAGPALLCIGSDESIRVWVNGMQVLDRRTPRQLTFDEDQVEVNLKAGDNTLLVKLEQHVGPWTFAARVLEHGAIPPRVQEIGPSLMEETPTEVVLRTDISAVRAALGKVVVQAVAAGGKVVAEKTASRGDTVRFTTTSWAKGAYEFRFVTHRLNGLLYATHTPWYKGDAIAAARELVAAAAKVEQSTPDGMTIHMLGDMIVDRVGKDLDAVKGNPWWAIQSPLMEYEELKLHAVIRPYGFLRLAYRDDIDGSPQFCRVYLPGGYDTSKKWPVVVQIHGYNGMNPEYVRWWSADMRHAIADTEFNGHQGVIYVEPHGRGNTQYLGLGDQDVLRVIQLVKRRLSVDEDRVYLRGDSMGGWGTWNVGTRHPELFAAIAPIYGGVDYHSTLSEEDLAKLTSQRRFLQEKGSSWALADGLLNMPILVHHGDVDQSVNVDFSRYGVRLLQRWGYNVRYVEMPGYGHEDLNIMTNIVNWFLEHRRNAQPTRVRIRSAELQHATAYWARVDQFTSPVEFMVVDAEIVGPNMIRLDSQNALAITLSPASELIDSAKPVEVVWNGESRKVNFDKGALTLRTAAYTPVAGEKSAVIAGPLGDIFNTPFAVVIGTSSTDPAMNEMLRRKGDAVADFWKQWQRQPARIFRDTEITDRDAARYSLLLIGGADSNVVARRFASKLPLEVTPDAVTVGGRHFAAKDACVMAIVPNPLNANRYALEVASTSVDGMYFCKPAALQMAEFDFRIQDGRMPDGTQSLPDSDLWIASGWFDREWKVREDSTITGSAEQRAKAVLLPAPRPDRAPDEKSLDALSGTYEIPRGPAIQIWRKERTLMAKVDGQSEIELLPVSALEFYIVEGPVRILFEKDADGKITGFKGWQNGQSFVVKKTK
jgi:dienelactone hydrolase